MGIDMHISDRIVTRRRELGVSQRALASVIGVSAVSVMKWESGQSQPRGKNLFALAGALKCSPTWLLFGDEDQMPTSADQLPIELDEQQKALLDLFSQLPDSEKPKIIKGIEEKVNDFNRLFDELLKVRKSQKEK